MVGPSAFHVSSADTSTMLLESDDDSGSINFSESSDSDVDYAQEKNWNETDYIVLEDMYEAVIAHGSGAQSIWRAIRTLYRGTKNSIYWTVWD